MLSCNRVPFVIMIFYPNLLEINKLDCNARIHIGLLSSLTASPQ